MDGDWEIHSEAELEATPEQMWRALATHRSTRPSSSAACRQALA
jgi:hypothetical protein